MLNEVKSSNMSTKQRSFRDNYRNHVKGWYNGFVHLAMIFIIIYGL